MTSINPITDIFVNADKQVATVALGVAFDGAKSNKLSPEQVTKVAKDFESVFLSQMLKALMPEDQSDENSFISNSEGDEIFRGMMMDEYAKSMTASGGIGIASFVERELLGQQGVAHRPVNYSIPIGAYQKAITPVDSAQDLGEI